MWQVREQIRKQAEVLKTMMAGMMEEVGNTETLDPGGWMRDEGMLPDEGPYSDDSLDHLRKELAHEGPL
jgi:hypothetical protein